MKTVTLVSAAGAIGLLVLFGSLDPRQLGAQSRAPSVGYDAASIKRSATGGPGRGGIEFLPGGRFRSVKMPFVMVLGVAYDIPTQSIESIRMRIKGMPDWVLSDSYDIEATAERGSAPARATSKVRNDRIRLMLQSVLADRFKLKVHQDAAEMPVYAMVVGPNGPKLAKATIAEQDCQESAPLAQISPTGPGCHSFLGGVGRGLRGNAVDMKDLALYVSNWSDRPIIDQTGLAGLYSIQTEGWTTNYNDDGSRPSLDEIFQRLGLKLARKQAPVPILLIEHIEKPSEN